MRIDLVAKKCVPAYMRTITAQEAEAQKQARSDFASSLKEFASHIEQGSTFHGGEQIDAVDIALAPWAARQYSWVSLDFLHVPTCIQSLVADT